MHYVVAHADFRAAAAEVAAREGREQHAHEVRAQLTALLSPLGFRKHQIKTVWPHQSTTNMPLFSACLWSDQKCVMLLLHTGRGPLR